MKAKKKGSIIVRLIVIGVSVYMIISLVGLWRDLDESKATLSAYQQKKEATQFQIDELKALLSDDSKKAVIEKAARERFGYAYPDEEIYIDASGN